MEDFRVDLGIFLNPENLQTVQSQIDSLSSRNVTLKINTQDVLKDVNLIKQQLKSIGVDFGGTTGVSTAVKKEMAEVENVVKRTTDVVSKELKKSFAGKLNDKAGGSLLTTLKGIEEETQEVFGEIGSITTEAIRNEQNEIEHFIVSIKNSIGEIEKLQYHARELLDKDGNATGQYKYYFTTSRSTDNNIKREEEATRKATQAQKEYEAQISKNNATVTKYTADLTSLQSKYTDSNAAKPITDGTHTKALETQYQNATRVVEALKSADKDTFTELKANADAEIQKLKDMVTQFRNAEYAANQLRAKPVETIKINEGYALDEFEAKVRQAGITSQEFYQKIAQLRTQLSNVGDKQSLTEYLNVLSNVKAESQALIAQKKADDQQAAQSQKGINEVFQRTLELEKQIGRTKVKIAGLDPEKDKAQIAELNNQLNTLVNESQLVKGEFSSAFSTEQILKLNDVIKETENRIAEIKAQLQAAQSQKVAEIKTNFSNGQYEKEVNAVKTSFDSLRNTTTELQTAMNGLDTAYANLKTAQAGSDSQKLVVAEEAYVNALKKVKNQLDINIRTEREAKAAQTLIDRRNTFISRIDSWLTTNSAAAKKFGNALRELQQQARNADAVQMKHLEAELRNITNQAITAGKSGKSMADRFNESFKTVASYFSASSIILRSISSIRNGINTILELDTALVDLRKTTKATSEELKEFYYSANESAKQLGVTTKDVIQAAADWSRLGYSIKDAETMAKTSSIFASISPNVDISKATDGLVSAMKAFNIEADDALDGIASKINAIGNSQAVSNEDIIEFLTRSSSAMKEANNTLDETIALGTAA